MAVIEVQENGGYRELALGESTRPGQVLRVTDDTGAVWEVWAEKGKIGELGMEKLSNGTGRPADLQPDEQTEAFPADDHP